MLDDIMASAFIFIVLSGILWRRQKIENHYDIWFAQNVMRISIFFRKLVV